MKLFTLALLNFVILGECSLLEMSQVLWTRLLAGGLTKGGALDPLRVPVVKVDQSEGNTSYRIVLRNVEIRGLNLSTLESVHIARGRLKANLSELEAGYVSYSDLRELDSIRYRFHTLVKEPKPRNHTEGKPSASFDSKGARNMESETPPAKANQRYQQKTEARDEIVDVVYAQNYMPFEKLGSTEQKEQLAFSAAVEERSEDGEESDDEQIECTGSCANKSGSSSSSSSNTRRADVYQGIRGNRKFGEFSEDDAADEFIGQDDAHVSASESVEQKQAFVKAEQTPRGERIVSSPESRNHGKHVISASLELPLRQSGSGHRRQEVFRQGTESARVTAERSYKTPPGYVDIIYADDDDKKIKHFAGFRRKDDENLRVYGLEEIRKEIERNNRYIVHNFTATEAIQKRNNMTLAAAESKRIKDLIRYAEKFQEKDGYFEQGMQLIYHFGGMDEFGSYDSETVQESDSNAAKRRKREHNNHDIEDDIMHVIIGIRVPLLEVKADYHLTGKVGNDVLRGNGLLAGSFNDLIGNFTLELRKVGKSTMVVRAARARLVASDRKVSFQGMNEKGPVESVLVHGLMAAEAVAAMIADDLATKALSENRANDAMIYKMYSNDPGSL
ncbi:uncharacterized protein LOC124303293 [Neodiprion virginianus]|uniref:uncharacterized protein LOC124303293 n=1 Tax=Neodiprion virginianus TaxID=2961670 RepID=UPI001EE71AAB|nr:uncharacterized protein LOC124303293 [Neodiprion virginianus]